MRHARSPAQERLASDITTASQEPDSRSAAELLPVGTRARRLQRRILLADHSLEGLYWVVDQFAIWPMLSVLRIIPIVIRIGPKARRDCGIPIRRQIRDLLRLVLVHGGKPSVDYMVELYRKGAMRDAGALIM